MNTQGTNTGYRTVTAIAVLIGIAAIWSMFSVQPIRASGKQAVVGTQSLLAAGPRLPSSTSASNAAPHVVRPMQVIPPHVQNAQVIRPQAPVNPRPGPPRRGAVIP